MSKVDLADFLTAADLDAICRSADPDVIEALPTDAPSVFPKAAGRIEPF
jgi:hypothetical protein